MVSVPKEMHLAEDRIPMFIIFIFLFLICLAAYFNSLNNDFIFEDKVLITENLYIKDWRFIGKIFKTDIFHFHPGRPASFNKYYRPLQALSYSLDYSLWRLNPAGFRLNNIFIHSLNSLLLFWLIYFIFKDSILALLSAVFFSLHPVHVLNVAYLSPRSSLIETFFVLSSVTIFFKSLLRENKLWYLCALFLFILAVLSRETALLLPLFVIICSLFLNIDKKKIAVSLIPYFLLAVFYIWLRTKFIPCDRLNVTPDFLLQRIWVFILLAQRYFSELILPVGHAVEFFGHNLTPALLLLLLSFVVMAYALVKSVISKDRILVFALLFYFVSLLPVVNLIGSINTVGSLLSEHYLYMPAMGFCVLLAYAIASLAINFLKTSRILAISVIFVFLFLVITANTHYKNDLTFYRYVLTIDPGNNLIRANLGNVYYKKSDFTQARKEARLVLSSEPGAWYAYLLLGNISKDSADPAQAEEFYKKTILLNPSSGLAFNNLAVVYKERGQDKEAEENFKKALSLEPESTLAMNNFADLLIQKKLYAQALVLCKEALRLDGDNIDSHIRMGIILSQTGHFREAEASLRKALEINPASVEAMSNLGVLYGNSGKLDKAISIWQKAQTLNPDDKSVKNNLEEAKRLKGLEKR